jgi:hypothetical protein
MRSITFTLIDKNINTIELASWVKELRHPALSSMRAQEALDIARDLKGGKTWGPSYTTIFFQPRAPSPCSALIKDPEQDEQDANFARDMMHAGLLKRGASGDAEAAIEYCRLLSIGAVNNYLAAFA